MGLTPHEFTPGTNEDDSVELAFIKWRKLLKGGVSIDQDCTAYRCYLEIDEKLRAREKMIQSKVEVLRALYSKKRKKP
jgi:hypothetical protein